MGGGQWQFYKFAKYTTAQPHRQFIIYGTFGRDLGALGGDLQANYFISPPSWPSRKINTALREAEGFNPPPNQIVTKSGWEWKSWIWLKLMLQVSIADLPNYVQHKCTYKCKLWLSGIQFLPFVKVTGASRNRERAFAQRSRFPCGCKVASGFSHKVERWWDCCRRNPNNLASLLLTSFNQKQVWQNPGCTSTSNLLCITTDKLYCFQKFIKLKLWLSNFWKCCSIASLIRSSIVVCSDFWIDFVISLVRGGELNM